MFAGIGGVSALKLVQKHGDLEAVMAQLDTGRYGIPDPFPFQEARVLFKGMLLHQHQHALGNQQRSNDRAAC